MYNYNAKMKFVILSSPTPVPLILDFGNYAHIERIYRLCQFGCLIEPKR